MAIAQNVIRILSGESWINCCELCNLNCWLLYSLPDSYTLKTKLLYVYARQKVTTN